MTKWLLLLLIAWGSAFMVFAEGGTGLAGAQEVEEGAEPTDNDLYPWPRAVECPFPWKAFEGQWTVRGEFGREYFLFSIVSVHPDRGPVFEISHYNLHHELLAVGRGIASFEDHAIRAVMTRYDESPPAFYWLILRAYVEDREGYSCHKDEMLTLMTYRSFEDGEGRRDLHYVIERKSRIGN